MKTSVFSGDEDQDDIAYVDLEVVTEVALVDSARELMYLLQHMSDDAYERNFSGKSNRILKWLRNHYDEQAFRGLKHSVTRQELMRTIAATYDEELAVKDSTVLKPKELYEKLSEFVIAQELAKKAVATEVYYHMLDTQDGKGSERYSGLCMIGPTGTGKTFIVETLSEVVGLPFSVALATDLTAAGFEGASVDSIILNHLNACGGNVALAERGIIYIDEIDKLAPRYNDHDDIRWKQIQNELLQYIGGSRIPMTYKGKHILFNTRNLLFLFGGAFEGLKEIVLDGKDESMFARKIQPSHLVKYGFLPEFTRRIVKYVQLHELSPDNLAMILTDSAKSPLIQYKQDLMNACVKLDFTDDALMEIARMAYEKKTGASGLGQVLEEVLGDFKFEAPSMDVSEYTVTREKVEGMKSGVY